MNLQTLLRVAQPHQLCGAADLEIADIVYDSRKAAPGALFFCVPGERVDGHNFARMAADKGAVAVVCQRRLDELPGAVTQVIVPDVRTAMGNMAHAFLGDPARSMRMIGITGTNGKTSTTYMMKAILEAMGKKVGLIGTIVNMIGDEKVYTDHTTPEAIDLAQLLARMRDAGVQVVVMEVSSHALALQRVAGIQFDVGAFTNLTQDHLDFHGDLDHYLAAKRLLFAMSKAAVVNGEDAAGEKMLEGFAGRALRFGERPACDIRATDVRYTLQGSDFALHLGGEVADIHLRIPGAFSVKNALAAAGCCALLGAHIRQIQAGLCALSGVPGRIQALPTPGLPFTVVLDYAHTPDGLENVLSSIRAYAQGRIITVFGCGGDRDRTKRPLMGKVAARLSDFCVVTSDNPRREDPMAIIRDILPGVTGCAHEIIEPREQAIRHAMTQLAQPGDVVLLAGKGHETYQEIDSVRHHFDEQEIVQKIAGEMLA